MASERGLDDSSAYLAPPPSGQPDAWTALGAGATAQRLLSVESIAPPAAVATALQLGDNERAVVRCRLMLRDGLPVELADSYYPDRIADGTPLADARKIKGGAPAVLAEFGLTTAYADESIELESVPTPVEVELLGLDEGVYVARLFRTAFTADDVPFEVSASVFVRAGRVLRHRIVVG